jgi:hypothetical protein
VTDTIFITGARRTGTTLMHAVICSDPRANLPVPEVQVLTRLIGAYHWTAANHDDFAAPLLGSPDQVRSMYQGWVREMLERISENVGRPGLLALKNPELMRVLRSLRALIPYARVIVMVRDPRDQIASEREVNVRQGREPLPVRRLANELRSSYAHLDPTGLTVVRYEDLVSDFKRVRRQLESGLGLDLKFDPNGAWPSLDGMEVFKSYPSWSPKLGAPVDSAGIGRYRRDLTASQAVEIESVCADYMEQFGYSKSSAVALGRARRLAGFAHTIPARLRESPRRGRTR